MQRPTALGAEGWGDCLCLGNRSEQNSKLVTVTAMGKDF